MHEYEHVDRTCDYVDPKVRVSTNTSLDTSICGADLLTVLEVEIYNLNHRIIVYLLNLDLSEGPCTGALSVDGAAGAHAHHVGAPRAALPGAAHRRPSDAAQSRCVSSRVCVFFSPLELNVVHFQHTCTIRCELWYQMYDALMMNHFVTVGYQYFCWCYCIAVLLQCAYSGV